MCWAFLFLGFGFMAFCGYGLVHPRQAREFVGAVCDLLGNGFNNTAPQMLLETAAQETHLGLYRDPTPHGAGRGLFQCDPISFLDVQRRARQADVDLVAREFGFEIRRVEHSALDSSPLLAAVFCRLHYKLRPEVFPDTLHGRAQYWKKHYNTELGKGAPDEYVRNALDYCIY